MASNLSTIGFVFADEEQFRSSMVSFAAKTAVQLDCPAGSYGIWRSRTGAELWFHFGPSENGHTEIFGLTPFFEGQSEMLLGITGPIHRDGDTAFEGAFYGWVKPDDSGHGAYPLVFDAVDFAARANLLGAGPLVATVKISGFARELKAYADEASYNAADCGLGTPQLAVQAFIPVGLFAAAEAGAANPSEKKAAPSSAALITGRVLEVSRMTNESTGQDFFWLLVDSLDATFDVLADPEIVSGEIVPGGIVEASVWLFGRIAEPAPATA